MEGRLKKVLVTGAQGALGTQVVQRFLKAGCEVVGTVSPHERVRQIEIEGAKAIQWIPVDLSRSDSVKSALQGQTFDALVHCAGGFRFEKVEQLTDEDLDFLINVYLKSAF